MAAPKIRKGDSEINASNQACCSFAERWTEFWFKPADAASLHLVRVVFGLTFLYSLLSLFGNYQALLGLNGWFDQQAYVESAQAVPDMHPNITGWSPLFVAGSKTALTALYFVMVLSTLLFTAGIATRITGVVTWLSVVTFTTNPATSFGGDALLLVFAFYLMVGYLLIGGQKIGQNPVGQWNLLKSFQASTPHYSVAARTTLRLVQVHLAIVLLTTGLHKLQIGAWWAGVPLWFPLHPPFETSMDTLEVNSPNGLLVFLSLAAYLTMAWQISFPFLAWRPSCRLWTVGGGAVALVGCVFWWGLPLFGPLVFAGCLAFVDGHRYREIMGRFQNNAGTETSAVPSPDTKSHAHVA